MQEFVNEMQTAINDVKNDPEKKERGFMICRDQAGSTSKTETIIGPDENSLPMPDCPEGAERVGMFHSHSIFVAPSAQDRQVAQSKGVGFQCVGTPMANIEENGRVRQRDVIYCELYDKESRDVKSMHLLVGNKINKAPILHTP